MGPLCAQVEVFCPLLSTRSEEDLKGKRKAILSAIFPRSQQQDKEGDATEEERRFFYIAECSLAIFIDPAFIRTHFGEKTRQQFARRRNRGKKKNRKPLEAHQPPPVQEKKEGKEVKSEPSSQRKRKLQEEGTEGAGKGGNVAPPIEKEEKKGKDDKGKGKEKEKEGDRQAGKESAADMVDGVFIALSVGSNIDEHNVVCILPTGKMVLSVTKDTYQQLGLVGQKSTFQKGDRFSILSGYAFIVYALRSPLNPQTLQSIWRHRASSQVRRTTSA